MPQPGAPPAVFDGVFYYISETIPRDDRDQLSEVLDTRHGTAVSVNDPKLTHFITTSLPLEEFIESLPEDSPAHIVTPFWVERSAILGSLQDPEFYYADPAFLFSGIVAAATDLSKSDCELISAAVTALGGQWRTALTRDVTHLFAPAPGSAKFETAMHYREQTGVRVLVPHWFDDTVRLGIRGLPTRSYEWPEPRVFHKRPEGRTASEDEDYEPPPERMMLYETASLSNDEQSRVQPAPRDVWQGKKLLLGLSLGLSDHQRKALYADIRRQGGHIVELSSSKAKAHERAREELAKMDEADVFVTRFRTGPAYAKAYQLKKTIGTLAWLWYVRASGTLTRPADQLLHYPIPDTPADGFDKEVVTVTNYTGKDREYLKKLITLMGGEFTASMAAEVNTVVVAAYMHGTKTDKATSWSIPIVNHTWVEDCFVQWRRLTPAREKYIIFPPGVDFSTVLAERGIGRITWEPGQLEEMQREAEAGADGDMHEEVVTTPKKMRRKGKNANASPAKAKPKVKRKRGADEDEDEQAEEDIPGMLGTAQSAVEVEEAVAMDEGEGEISLGAQMDVDADFSSLKINGARKARDDEMDVDEEEGEQAGPTKPPVTNQGPPSKRATREKDAAPAEVPTKRRLVRRYTPRKTDDEEDADEAQEEDDEAPPARDGVTTPSPTKHPAKKYGSARAKRTLRGREAAQMETPSPVKRPQSTRRKAARVEEDVEMAEEEQSSEDDAPAAKTKELKKAPGTRSAKGKEKEKEQPAAQPTRRKAIQLPSSDSDSDSTDEEMRSVLGDLLPNLKGKARAGATSPTKARRTPQRFDSVLVPTVAQVYSSPARQNGETPLKVGPPRKARKSAAPPAPAAEEADDSAPARGTGAKTKKAARAASPAESGRSTPPPAPAPAPAAKTRGTGKSVLLPAENAEAGPSRASTSTVASPTKAKRSAATKATEKLHEIMPDVISFQKEMKKGAVRAMHEQSAAAAAADTAAAKGKTPAKGKKRQSILSAGAGGEEDEDEEMPERKKRKPNDADDTPKGAAKGKKAAGRKPTTVESEEPESRKGPPAKKAGLVAATSNGTMEAKNVRVMTTQLTLAEDVVRGLTKLGVKIVTKPSECTHLLARSVVRTEKFLCAMAVAPHVLGEKWALMSAANKRLLPEADYAIKDEATEEKYGFTLADALKRAKKNAGKLFGGMTFYVTAKVSVDTKLLKNVVTANGGQVSTQKPTLRILAGHTDRFVISCPEDASIWRQLAKEGHKIYTQELLLTSALKQTIDLEDTGCQVVGSYDDS